jgi:N-acetyl-gamma-glutamyl-phosphate reductase
MKTSWSARQGIDFDAEWHSEVDVVFLCAWAMESRRSSWMSSGIGFDGVLIIDLSQDFRLKSGGNSFIYGLPELNREEIRGAQAVANPGCFATAIQLGLLPLAKAGLAGRCVYDGHHGEYRVRVRAYRLRGISPGGPIISRLTSR